MVTSNTPFKIAVVGETFDSSRTVQRANALKEMGHDVMTIPTTPPGWTYETRPSLAQRVRHRLRLPADPAKANQGVINAVRDGVEIVWIEAGKMIHATTLAQIREINSRVRILWYSEDDMMNPAHRSRWLDRAIPYFDLWVTTKSFNAEAAEMPSRGAKKVLFVNNSFDAKVHRPVAVSPEQRRQFGAPVSFIGTFEEPRANSLLALAQAGMTVRVWGNGWGHWVNQEQNLRIENRPVYNDDFARVIAASDINLGFLRKGNRDLQTCRSIEIPACAGFMIHERNSEMTALLCEDREAVYWSTNTELVSVCQNWSGKDDARKAVGQAGRNRVLELGLTHEDNISRMLSALMDEN